MGRFSGSQARDESEFYDPSTGVRYDYNPYSDVPDTPEAMEGATREAAAQAGVSTKRWRNAWNNGGGSSGGGRGRGGGRGGGGGGSGPSPQDIAALKDRFNDQVQGLTGLTPDQLGVNFDWYRPKWEGGWSQSDFERYYRTLPVFQEEYPGITEGLSTQDYNSAVRQLNKLSLEARGGVAASKDDVTAFMRDGKVPF